MAAHKNENRVESEATKWTFRTILGGIEIDMESPEGKLALRQAVIRNLESIGWKYVEDKQ